jgi:hypothetical protein
MMRLMIMPFCFLILGLPSLSHALEASNSEEFAIKRRYEIQKVEDFYTRLNELERREAERRKGADEVRQKRILNSKEYEAARQEYVRMRKAKPIPNSLEWEQEQKAKAKLYEQARADYVRHRDQLRKELRGVGAIPEEDEFDFNLNYENEY